MSAEEKLALCQSAIAHVLSRIREDDKVRYHLGVGTESFSRLTKAYAALTGEPIDRVRNFVIPGSAAIHRGDDE